MTTATLSSKGQITIPKSIREHYGLKAGDKIEFLEDDRGIVTIWPVSQDVTRLKGMVTGTGQPVSIEAMKRAIQEEGGRR